MEGKVPASIHVDCPECETDTLHRTLKGRFSGKKKLDMVLKCTECGRVHEERFEMADQIPVRSIISRSDKSEKIQIELSSDWAITVGDELMHQDERLLVTGIEVDGMRVNSAAVGDIQTLWTKNFDTVDVHVSVNRRGKTKSVVIVADPDDEFEVGSEIEIDGRPVFVHSIKMGDRKIRKGTATAREIVRVYCTDKGRRRSRKSAGS